MRRMNRLECAAFLALIGFVVSGCQSASPIDEGPVVAEMMASSVVGGVTVYGELDEQKLSKIAFLASCLKPEVWSSVQMVVINDDDSHYDSLFNAGHCHSVGGVCVKSAFIDDPLTLWHEAAHAWHFHLAQTGSDFEKEWIKISGSYRKMKEGINFPTLGFLNPYSAQNIMEDVACVFAAVYGEANGLATDYTFLRASAANRDKRYRQKVELLRKYGFFTTETYRKFLALDLLPKEE